jgi:hypothetical protein
MTRRPKPRRRKHTLEEPLGVSGTVLRPIEHPARPRIWLRPLRTLIELLPFYQETRRGREFAVFVRLILGIAAVMMVTKGRAQWVWGAAGVLTALSSLLVPLGEVRRRRWLRNLDAMAAPTTSMEPRPATLDFDGRKASIRVDGLVWRSLRPFDPTGSVRVLGVGERLWLGLVPPAGRKRDQLWFSASAHQLADRISPEEYADEPPDVGMHLEPDGFCEVYEAFIYRL